jgi:PBP1b-binding outer membrane lipoprotein LpoB
MINTKNLKILSFITILSFLLIGCNGKLPGGDARKNSPDPAERVKKKHRRRSWV